MLAEKINVSPSAVAAWEAGTTYPAQLELTRLAYHFGCSSEDLIRNLGKNTRKILTNTYYIMTDRELEDGWWGHFGVKLPGHEKSRWYPITIGTADLISSKLRNYDEESDKWIIVETLNNRILLIAPDTTKRLWLLDDAQDQPDDDWVIEKHGYEGEPAEFYKALRDYCSGDEESKTPAGLSDFIDTFTDVQDLGDEEVNELILYTHVYDKNGEQTSYWVDAANLIELIDDIEMGDNPSILDLSSDDFDSFFPSGSVSMVDMPRMLILDEREFAASKEAPEE